MTSATATYDRGWLVSRRWDLSTFGLPALASLALLIAGHRLGILDADTPLWAWVVTVVVVDVAHVWSTVYRVYLDPVELAGRPGLYLGSPLLAYVVGVVAYGISSALFWRLLAYLAVIHFVRQQYGWIALYRRRLGVDSRLDRWLDNAAIYSATLFPLVWWHANLPREFHWFLDGDFIPGLPHSTATLLHPLHIAITIVYVARQLQLVVTGRQVSPGKNLVMATTWLAWYGGIVLLDSDYAFTVTNVLIHGVPYLALVWRHSCGRWRGEEGGIAKLFRRGRWPLFLAPLIVVAWCEEWAWDRFLWHDHGVVFPGPELSLPIDVLALVVPLLAVPQATHYILDAFIWKVRGRDHSFLDTLERTPAASENHPPERATSYRLG